ncbi:hypothetical protein D9M69_566700 [compost metagenome]
MAHHIHARVHGGHGLGERHRRAQHHVARAVADLARQQGGAERGIAGQVDVVGQAGIDHRQVEPMQLRQAVHHRGALQHLQHAQAGRVLGEHGNPLIGNAVVPREHDDLGG